MNRTGIILSAVLTTIGVAKVIFPATVASLFSLDIEVALFALAVAVLAYGVWFGPLKFLSGSKLAQLIGFSLFATGLASISSPTLWGLRESFVPIADIFIVIEAGILLQLIGLEKKQAGTTTPFGYANNVWSSIQRRSHRGQSQTPVSNYVSNQA